MVNLHRGWCDQQARGRKITTDQSNHIPSSPALLRHHRIITVHRSPSRSPALSPQCVFARPRVTGHWASERKVSGEQRQRLQCQVCPTMPKLCPPAIRHSNTVLAFTPSVQISGGCKLTDMLFSFLKEGCIIKCIILTGEKQEGHKPPLFSSEAASAGFSGIEKQFLCHNDATHLKHI